MSDPELRERLRAAGQVRSLPPMTAAQRRLYGKLRPLVGREAALAEAMRKND